VIINMGNLLKSKARAHRYKRAHNVLTNNIAKGLKGFYFASRKFGFKRIRYDNKNSK